MKFEENLRWWVDFSNFFGSSDIEWAFGLANTRSSVWLPASKANTNVPSKVHNCAVPPNHLILEHFQHSNTVEKQENKVELFEVNV